MFVLRIFLVLLFCAQQPVVNAQFILEGRWLFTITRPGGLPVHTQVEFTKNGNNWQAVFHNHIEAIRVTGIEVQKDSVHFEMPVFESSFRLKIASEKQMTGNWSKGISTGLQVWNVTAIHGQKERIPATAFAPASYNISGRWAMSFQRADGSWRQAVAEFKQMENHITGTVINPSGDARFLEGAVHGTNLYLTTFDGSHSYAFAATIANDSTLVNGLFFSGNPPGEAFKATKNAAANLPGTAGLIGMQPGQTSLSFQFPDADSNMVSILDSRFKNKVVIVQIMGSWCSNCMDETKFLSEFYNSQPTKEVEVVALAYELSTDFTRSATSLRKFQQRFNVQYPMLITGARSADAEKAAKTLPQLTDIKYFPTTIFIDKKGQVRKIHNGFHGPSAPAFFEAFKKEFFETLEMLKEE